MVSLRPPGLGPIVGHTSDTTARIWSRAGDPADKKADLNEDRRTVGVIGVVKGKQIANAYYFRLNREYDRTGSFLLGSDVQLGFYPSDREERGIPADDPLSKGQAAVQLQPDTEYTVRVGTLTIDDPLPNEVRLADSELIDRLPKIDAIKNELLTLDPEQSEARFRTFPTNAVLADTVAFLLGSCRYPGLLWKIKEADRIFGPMRAHFEPDSPFGTPARFTMMCGDQIYADMLNRNVPLLRADTYAEFQQRYTEAFEAHNLRKLLRLGTNYMILDDHEIEDNWTQDRITSSGGHQLFNVAITAYMNYQWSHGPRTYGRLLYYQFSCGGYPFFVLDTRTQRVKNTQSRDSDKRLRDNHLLGRPTIDASHPGQLQLLLDWLEQQQQSVGNAPKFIVSSSVFVPNAIDERIEDELMRGQDQLLFKSNEFKRDDSDSWPAFPLTRQAILEKILEKRIQNVVFLSGDIHCSNNAQISFAEEPALRNNEEPIRAFSVTSSAFYWPFPFADGDPNGYVHDSQAPNQWDPFPLTKGTMHYTSNGFTREDNFARLDIDKAGAAIFVRVFDHDGKLVKVSGADAGGTTKLQLTRW